MRSLIEIQQLIDKLALQISPPTNIMPTYDNLKHDGTPNIEIGDSLYYYRAFDRDTVSLNRQTDNLANLLYWVFEDITSTMASNYVREHRDPQINSRKVRFEHQLMLLDKINHEWKELREKEIEEILKNSPYEETY
jgi:hypothetical protein